MIKLKTWLQQANGWKRLWFVLSSISILYMVLINPFVLNDKNNISKYEWKWKVEDDFKKPECITYIEKPINLLIHPKDGSTCIYLYAERKIRQEHDVYPYTLEKYESDFEWREWKNILGIMGGGLLITIIISGLVYFFGVIINWIRIGFKK